MSYRTHGRVIGCRARYRASKRVKVQGTGRGTGCRASNMVKYRVQSEKQSEVHGAESVTG